MQHLPTVVLHHETKQGSHYDWLLAQPLVAGSEALIWAGRTTHHSRHWHRRGTWWLHRLAPHRAYYFTYQGPIPPKHGRHRGRIRRVDQGTLVPKIWTPTRIVAAVSMRFFEAIVEIRLIDHLGHRVSVIDKPPGATSS